MEIIFAPVLAPALLGFLGFIIILLSIWSLIKARRSLFWRLGAALIIFAGLLNPQVQSTKTNELTDIALVLVDKSSSQNIGKRAAIRDQALAQIKTEAALHKGLDLRIIDITPDAQEEKTGTRAMTRMRHALSGIDPARFSGSILISDGQIHDVDDIEGLSGPVHLLINADKNDKDRRIELIDAPRYALVGKAMLLRAKVLDNGQSNPNAPLYLIHEDGTRQKFTPDEEGNLETVYIAKHAGQATLLLQTPDLADEISLANNQVALNINGVRDRLRVLLVSGQPHQGQRTWRNILRSDPAVDLIHFTILRPSEKEDFTPLNELSLIAFPVRELFEEKLDDFDLIIFDRYYRHHVLNEDYFNNIVRYVQKGGALLISAGPDFAGPLSLAQTPLKQIFPLQPATRVQSDHPFRLKRTDIGKRHPVSARLDGAEKSWGRWMRVVGANDISGQTILASEDDQPILVVNRVEKGRLAVLLSDHLWLWARGFDGGGPHQALVRNLVHWLMQEPELEEEKLTLRQIDGETIEIARQSLSSSNPAVTLTAPDGKTQTVTLKEQAAGLYVANVEAIENGIYKASDGQNKTVLAKGNLNSKELNDPRPSDTILRPLIDQSGGSIHWLEETSVPKIKHIDAQNINGARGWIGLKKNGAQDVTGVTQSSLLPTWLIFFAAGLFWCLAWWREGR